MIRNQTRFPPTSTARSHWRSPLFDPLLFMAQFVPAFVLEFVDRNGRPFAACERYIAGSFKKHNNNVGSSAATTDEKTGGSSSGGSSGSGIGAAGGVGSSTSSSGTSSGGSNSAGAGAAAGGGMMLSEKDEDNLDTMMAQAFSHFTFEKSDQKILICDIQGESGHVCSSHFQSSFLGLNAERGNSIVSMFSHAALLFRPHADACAFVLRNLLD